MHVHALLPFLASHTPRDLTLDWNMTLPHSTGTTLADEIQCYSIPYGLIGFLSHLLSYYTILITAFGRRPLAPWRPLEERNRIVNILQLIGTVGLALYTIYACHNRWQFVLLGVWKLLWNVVKSVWGVATSWRVFTKNEAERLERRPGLSPMQRINLASKAGTADRKGHNFLVTLTSGYCCAAIVGLVGVASLVSMAAGDEPRVLTITEVFGAVAGALGLLFFVFGALDGEWGVGFNFMFIIVAIMFALYSDWILGVIGQNLMGVPPQDNRAFYWVSIPFGFLPP
jgi:hypothetical protein